MADGGSPFFPSPPPHPPVWNFFFFFGFIQLRTFYDCFTSIFLRFFQLDVSTMFSARYFYTFFSWIFPRFLHLSITTKLSVRYFCEFFFPAQYLRVFFPAKYSHDSLTSIFLRFVRSHLATLDDCR